jgi:hypothetical protein
LVLAGLRVDGAERRTGEHHADADLMALLDLVEGGVGVGGAQVQAAQQGQRGGDTVVHHQVLFGANQAPLALSS